MKTLTAAALAATLPFTAAAQDFTGEPVPEPLPPFSTYPDEVPPLGMTDQPFGAATSAPGMAAAPGAAGPGAQPFRLYRGSEVSLDFAHLWDTPGGGGAFSTLALDTRSSFGLAPFLGAQVDLGVASLDWGETAITAGLHFYLTPDTGDRVGFFWLPARVSGFDEWVDNYGIEGMFAAFQGLTVEARAGRFDADDLSGPYLGATGFYALNPAVAITASFQYNWLDVTGLDVNVADAVIGAEYYLPGTDIRLSGGIGLVGFSGEVSSQTDFKVELGATLFTFGEPATTARTRTFGRQSFVGTF